MGRNGEITLSNLGKVKVVGKSIEQIEKEIQRKSRKKDNFWTDFQIEVTGFNSQKAYLTINANADSTSSGGSQTTSNGGIIKLTDQSLTLRELLTQSGVSIKPGISTRIRLQRNNKTYSFGLNEVYATNSQKIRLKKRLV